MYIYFTNCYIENVVKSILFVLDVVLLLQSIQTHRIIHYTGCPTPNDPVIAPKPSTGHTSFVRQNSRYGFEVQGHDLY